MVKQIVINVPQPPPEAEMNAFQGFLNCYKLSFLEYMYIGECILNTLVCDFKDLFVFLLSKFNFKKYIL